ncbi:MAG: vWA domain-containing protein [Polyangiaceae bacterium]
MTLRRLTVLFLVGVCSLQSACGDSGDDGSQVTPNGTSGTGAKGGGGGSGSDAGIGAFSGTGGGELGDADVCAAESYAAEPAPVDLYIMLDQSTSMNNKLPDGKTLWSAITGAISDFVASPAAGGIGVGIQYFGLGTGAAACNVSQYATPDVPITSLPGAQTALKASLGKHAPQSFTPTGPALEGALAYAKTWAAAHADHTTIVVLATDGYPSECEPQSTQGLADLAAAALSATPRVFTFVIGIGSLWNLNNVAKAGGTREALIVSDTSGNAAQELQSALLAVATAPLACDYAIPTPKEGGSATLGKINVEFTDPKGQKHVLGWVKSAADCNQVSEGWYYDDPTTPTRIMICPKTCTSFGTGKLDILLGCDTVVVR